MLLGPHLVVGVLAGDQGALADAEVLEWALVLGVEAVEGSLAVLETELRDVRRDAECLTQLVQQRLHGVSPRHQHALRFSCLWVCRVVKCDGDGVLVRALVGVELEPQTVGRRRGLANNLEANLWAALELCQQLSPGVRRLPVLVVDEHVVGALCEPAGQVHLVPVEVVRQVRPVGSVGPVVGAEAGLVLVRQRSV